MIGNQFLEYFTKKIELKKNTRINNKFDSVLSVKM